LEHINKFGAPSPIEGTDFFLHPLATPTGGLSLPDHDGVSARGFKDLAAKLAGTIMKGELAAITQIEHPVIL
jgi:hypothetical protein|tara:strand:+ start:93 stop:308 length:216 start_codon:yes stop_codon:yes gene_type:complete